MELDCLRTAKSQAALTQDQRDQLAVDEMLLKLHPKGWAALKSYLQGCLDTVELLQDKSA